MRKLWDRALLIGIALLVCLVAGGAFWIGDTYHINPVWIFFAWNTIFAIPVLWKPFHSYLKRPGFVVFFLIWIVIHGATVAGMMFRLSIEFWPVVVLLELTAGFLVAQWLFGYPLEDSTEDEEGGPRAKKP
jgi:hypothetical protein